MDLYVESETERIDGLIKELRAERRRIVNEKDDEPNEISDEAKGHAIRVGMGFFIHALLDGRGKFALDAGVPMWGKHVNFNIHGIVDLDHEELYALAQTEFGSNFPPEDGSPGFDTRVNVCDEHISCMVLEVEVYFSDHDWETLTG